MDPAGEPLETALTVAGGKKPRRRRAFLLFAEVLRSRNIVFRPAQ
ncbi:MAG TPA: hypothetical protein VMT95_11760 [Candidatus Binatia bacterium]|nr:hypothetical protein [Candidatus Binatia bacterium]